MCLGRDAKGRPISDETTDTVKVLSYIGRDGDGRPVYKDKEGTLWKDTCNLCNGRYFHSSLLSTCEGNTVEGEPLEAMKDGVFIVFVPNRMH